MDVMESMFSDAPYFPVQEIEQSWNDQYLLYAASVGRSLFVCIYCLGNEVTPGWRVMKTLLLCHLQYGT